MCSPTQTITGVLLAEKCSCVHGSSFPPASSAAVTHQACRAVQASPQHSNLCSCSKESVSMLRHTSRAKVRRPLRTCADTRPSADATQALAAVQNTPVPRTILENVPRYGAILLIVQRWQKPSTQRTVLSRLLRARDAG